MKAKLALVAILMIGGSPCFANDVERAVLEKLDGIRIPRIVFQRTPVREAVDFLKQKIREYDPNPDPTRRGISILVRLSFTDPTDSVATIPGMETEPRTPKPRPQEPLISYVGTDVSYLDVLTEVARQARFDVCVTSVGIVLVPRGQDPFPNDQSMKGQIYRRLPTPTAHAPKK